MSLEPGPSRAREDVDSGHLEPQGEGGIGRRPIARSHPFTRTLVYGRETTLRKRRMEKNQV